MTKPSSTSQDWTQALQQGGRAALARAITLVENDAPEARDVLRAARALTGHALVVGVTGAPGAGKSTLVGAYVAELRRRDLSVGVLAVDPSSPLTGGALLGDRIRMLTHAGDPGVFVRSLASRGHLGGLARSAGAVVDVMDAAGRDVVVVETVGVGQSEIEVTDLADIRVVVWAPGAGDDVQAAKAGILEIADVLVMRTIATNGTGVPDLANLVAELGQQTSGSRAAGAARRLQRQLIDAAAQQVRERAQSDPGLAALCEAVRSGDLDLDEAASRLIGQQT
ncbi:MAG: methylmalonyl Co-A mutase-associated GTPase MeaB [Alphaproteobacteria bacterium]